MVRSPSSLQVKHGAQAERPMRRWISCVRPFCLPRAASRSLRVWVARAACRIRPSPSPSPLPRLCGAPFFHRRGAQHLGVAKLDEHRAFGVHGVVAGDAHGRNWSAARWPERWKVVISAAITSQKSFKTDGPVKARAQRFGASASAAAGGRPAEWLR